MNNCGVGIVVLMLGGVVACESEVDICGDIAVCGTDMVLYGDYCEAASAGVEVIAEGGCPNCMPVTCEIACEFGFQRGPDGCEVCACADPPPDGGVDAGTDAGIPDASTVDATMPDTGTPDAMIVCPDSQILCGGECKSPDTTEQCGGCDPCAEAANATASCHRGEAGSFVCSYECYLNFANCDASPSCETNIASVDRCGSCDMTVCPSVSNASPVCVPTDDAALTPYCDFECADGFTRCGDRCLDPSSDEDSCGVCGNVCDGLRSCTDGGCTRADFCNNPENWEYRDTGMGGCVATCGRLQVDVVPGAGAGDASASCTLPGGGVSICDSPDEVGMAACSATIVDCCRPAIIG